MSRFGIIPVILIGSFFEKLARLTRLFIFDISLIDLGQKRSIMKALKRLIQFIGEKINQITAFFLYVPDEVLSLSEHKEIVVLKNSIGEFDYKQLDIPGAAILKVDTHNVSILYKGKLVPEVSMQFNGHNILSDSENTFLLKKSLPKRRIKKVPGTVISLISGTNSMYNYYHWLYDALPRLKIIESNRDVNQYAKYYVPNIEFKFQKETLDLIGINPDQIISGKEMPCIRADEVIVTTQINYPRKLRPWAVDFLREKFLLHANSVQFSPFVYISRGDAPNQRKLLNEKELLDKLMPLGFESYKLSELSVKDQISLFFNATAVVGVHGAGMANLTFCKPGTVVFELFSENYQSKTFKSISDYLTLEYHNISTTPTEKYKKSPVFQSIELPEKEMDHIKKRVDKILNSI